MKRDLLLISGATPRMMDQFEKNFNVHPLDAIDQVAEKIEAGIVWINCWLVRDLRTPFGGVKNSGVGREGGFEALRFFTEPKNVCVQY